MSRRGTIADWLTGSVAPLRGGGRGWVVVTVAAGWFVTLGLRFVIPGLLPQIKATFAVDNASAGLAVSVIWLTYAGMQLPAGALVDRVGERVLLSSSLLVAGISLLMFGFLPTFGLFLGAAALFGLGTGLFGTPRGTVLSNTFDENDGAAFGVTLAAGSLGAAALPFVATSVSLRVGGQFGNWAGWQTALAGFAPLFFAIAAGVWWAVPSRANRATGHEQGDPEMTAAENESAVEPGAGAPTDDNRIESDSQRTFWMVVRAAIQREVLLAAVGAMFVLFTFQGLTAFYTTYLIEQKGLAETTAGGLFGLLFLSGAVCQSTAGRAADRFGHRAVLTGIAALSIPPLAALPFVNGVVPLALLTIPIGIRISFGPVVNSYVVDTLPADVQGTAWGLVRTAFFAVGSTGSFAVGVVADTGRFDVAVFGLAALTLPAIGVFAILPDRDAGP